MSPTLRVPPRTRRRATATFAATAATIAASFAVVGATPSVAVPADPDCPVAFPVGDLTGGQAVTGLTTSTGTTPDGFTGQILGVLEDGILPGRDLILARLSSPEINRVGGIWSGMSGSPVYAADGRLVGAVAYGLALGPSTVAGITPAEDMQELLSSLPEVTPRAAARLRVDLPAAMERTLVAAGGTSARAAESGMRQLRLPVAVSGPETKRLAKLRRQLGLKNVHLYRAAAGGADAAAATDIVPGGNLSVSLSYGDFTFGAIGTVTAVCGDEVLGFGHPMFFSGRTSLALGGATTVHVQEDPTLAPYELANPSAPVGTINGDRLAGVAGELGELPATTRLSSTVTSADTGRTRTGISHVTQPESLLDALPFMTFYAHYLHILEVFDAQAPGSARVRYTISGTTDDGQAFSLERADRFASSYDITFEPAWEPADDLYTLLFNDFTDLTIEEVTVNSRVSSQVRQFEVTKVERRVGGEWKVLKNRQRLSARPGAVLELRVTADSFRDRYGSVRARIDARVPRSAQPGSRGFLRVSGGESTWGGGGPRPTSFAELVERLESAPRNDTIVAQLYAEASGGGEEGEGRVARTTATKRVGEVVSGGRSFRIRLMR